MCGEIMLVFDVIENWDMELKEVNKNKVDENHFVIPTPFFFYLNMLKHIFIFHTDRPKELHKDMLKGEYLPFPIISQ